MADLPTVAVIGGANSAGEAAAHLARYASAVSVIVRGPSLAGRMSQYLIDQLTGLANVTIRLNAEVVDATDDGRLRSVTIRDRERGTTAVLPTTGLFVLIGAGPRTDWLPDEIQRDARGFVLTGEDAAPTGERDGQRQAFETTMPGVYAVGDIRHGSIKRVAAAVGEGANAIRQVLGTEP